jgi:formylglycine-generating enzyme required for sulfatase activity
MSYCFNPHCWEPQNPSGREFCQNCGRAIALLNDRYRVIRSLGKGRFTRTYLAEDLEVGFGKCAIEQFAPLPGIYADRELWQQTKIEFGQEAERLLQLERHPQIAKLIDYFEVDNCLYSVSHFVPGLTLKDELEQQGNFSEAKILELLNDLLPVLQFIHQHQVIHGDIQPEKIIRTSSAASSRDKGNLVLVDFAIAQTRSRFGKPRYAPLEQMRGFIYPASDLYSLGVTCIRLLTGCLPPPDTPDEFYHPISDRWLWQELPQGKNLSLQLQQVLNNLLPELVKDRYQSAEEVLAALNFSNAVSPSAVGGSLAIRSAEKTGALVKPVVEPGIDRLPQPTAIANTQKLAVQNFEVITVNARGKTVSTRSCEAQYLTEDLGGGVTLEMACIPSGNFQMGSPGNEEGRFESEHPQHSVAISSFFIGKFLVTQKQWEAIMQTNPSHFKGPHRPVEQISWHEANEFCQRLAQKTGKPYRLPSEAEWEYAARAGTTGPFHFGDTITAELANYDATRTYASGTKGLYRRETTPVGTFSPNSFGLYDVHGNVWEWCADPWHDNYQGAPTDGRVWEQDGHPKYRVLRGGSSGNHPRNCRSSDRGRGLSDYWYFAIGFRVACS